MNFSVIDLKNSKLPTLSRVLLTVAGCLLFVALLFPIWKMELSAPQYPEGLNLYLCANKISGDVDSINDLNHYIGMKMLHSEDFIEFTVLPYIISFFGVLTLACAVIGRKRWAIATLILFALFGIVSLFDFYNWNYNYGHNLSPTAAIKVPGMAYQPPIIGYKQLLNFGVYSIPALGGMIMILSGLITAFVVFKECNLFKIFSKKSGATMILVALLATTASCSIDAQSRPIQLNKNVCAGCQMSVTDLKFGTEFISDKGKCYVFDDFCCMIHYVKNHKQMKIKAAYVPNYLLPTELILVKEAFFVKSDDLQSPMQGNTAAFKSKIEADKFAKLHKTKVLTCAQLELPAGLR